MDVRVGDKLQMKKPHPCGTNVFEVLVPRHKCEKNIRKIVRESAGSEQ